MIQSHPAALLAPQKVRRTLGVLLGSATLLGTFAGCSKDSRPAQSPSLASGISDPVAVSPSSPSTSPNNSTSPNSTTSPKTMP